MRSILLRLITLLLILASLSFVPASVPAHAAPSIKTLDALWQRTSPIIDGNLSDWSAHPKQTLDKDTASYPPPNQRPAANDLSAWASIVWDSDKLYIAVNVTDENVVRRARNWYLDDMAEFTFDVDKDGAFSLGDLRLTLSPDGLVTNNGGLALGVISDIRRNTTGWQGELSLPLEQFGADFLSNAEVGFTWGVQDRDEGAILQQLVWEGATFSTPSPGQGLMRFTNGPIRRWITARPGVNGYDGIVEANLNGWQPDTNNGSAGIVSIRGNEQWHLAMKITPPPLAPGVRPLQARLHLNLADIANNPNNSGASRARLYRLLRPWDENTVTWNKATASERWARPGASSIGVDRSDIVIAEAQLNPQTRSYTWDISSQIQDLYANPNANFGFLLRGEAGANVWYQFYASECTANPTCAPWIEVYIEEPPP